MSDVSDCETPHRIHTYTGKKVSGVLLSDTSENVFTLENAGEAAKRDASDMRQKRGRCVRKSRPDVGSRPLSKQERPGNPSKKRDMDHRCFTVAEISEALEMPHDALQACIRGGALQAVDIGCRRLLTAGAVLAFVPERRRVEVGARLDDVESRRGGRHG